jgi:uncharacterized membrane protein YqgA involved in biofilm formation
MWSVLNGTIVNAATVAVGSGIGLAFSARIPERYQRIILDCLGLVTITLGVDAAVLGMSQLVKQYGGGVPTYGARLGMVMVGSLIVGAVIGTALRLQDRLEGMGRSLHRRFHGSAVPDARGAVGDASGGAARFAEGFLSASVIFCVGPLTLLGCLANGAQANPSLLYIKAFLDGFCSMALAAALGAGVAASIVTVLVFQGGLALLARATAGGLNDLSIQMMNVVGGVLLLATALMLLELKRIPVANLLPAIFLPPLAIWLVELVGPGLLVRP